MTYPKLIKQDNNKNQFEYDGGDLWVRKNVSYCDDQDNCWNNDILQFFDNAISIKDFLWKINYTIPYASQIQGLKDNQEYKIRKDNRFYCEVIKYSKKQLKRKVYKKGNVIFWKGHVAICINSKKLIHAYGPEKKVLIMPISKTIERIKKTANLSIKKISSIKY